MSVTAATNHPGSMHELSIVMSIVDIADQHVRAANAQAVESIDLEIGELSGIEMDALNFVWESGVKDSVLEGSQRRVNRIPGSGACLECGKTVPIHSLLDSCPECNSYFLDIKSGKELRVKSLVLIGSL